MITTNPDQALNLTAAITLCGGKEDIALEIIQMLINELSQHQNDLKIALMQKNWHDMEYISHKLAGSAAYCGMELLKKQARTLNNSIRQEEWNNVAEQTEQVQQAILATLSAAADLNITPQK
jgi:HPt (histidine-containing phosphotransfer) domain-containing protein